jgi:predicted dehydrogenase
MSSSRTRIRPKNAAIVGLGWWGQHILRQMIGSDVVRIVYAVGSREEHRRTRANSMWPLPRTSDASSGMFRSTS